MLEILLLIFLCRRIKGIVAPKGYSAGRWQLYVVLFWIMCEIFGYCISIILGKDFIVAILSGMLFAAGGYLLLQSAAKKLPDAGEREDSLVD